MTTPATLTRAIGGLLRVPGSEDLCLPVLVRYAAADPFAVRVVLLLDAESSVEWLLARDQLAEALQHPVGVGDVRLFTDGTDVVVELGAGEPPTRLLLPLRDVVEVLASSYELVPTGTESLPDAELEALLRQG